MNRSKIENFAGKARNLLKSQISARVELLRKSDSTSVVIENRNALSTLEKKIEEKGLESVVDEVAYTWFNRLCALRYMDAHGFNRPLVVTPLEGNVLPEILSDAMTGSLDSEILTKANEDRITKLLLGEVKSPNAQSEIYRILLVSKCNALNKDIPMLFERISDYTDLLLPEDLLSKDAIIPLMCEALPDESCQTVEVIGWLYQYYIAEKKSEVIASFKKGKKATSKEIPAATQLFTPEWIVRYLVENSLGRLWMLNHPDSRLIEKMTYYIKPSNPEPDYIKISTPEEIKICDPCCGSGHMLTYCFDILFEIYSELGYTSKDAVEHIIKDNLYGIELDNRAGQLAYFALMMKAREKSRRFFSLNIEPNICVLNNVIFNDDEIPEAAELFAHRDDMVIEKLLKEYEHADTLGSLITPVLGDMSKLKELVPTEMTGSLFDTSTTLLPRVKEVVKYSEYLSQRYHVVVTNPPYMGNSNMGEDLKKYLEKEYLDYKYDMFSAFFVRCCNLAITNGYLGFMSPYVWMFISSYEKTRKLFIENKTITSLAQLEYSAFEDATVPLCVFTLKNAKNQIKGSYFRLTEFRGGMEVQDKKVLEAISNKGCGYYYEVSAEQFKKIPGWPIAYWVNEHIFMVFGNSSPIVTRCKPLTGLQTGDNGRFLRLWHEISDENAFYDAFTVQEAIGSGKKWFPITKGGSYRKWYGNKYYLINWKNNGEEIKSYDGSVIRNESMYFSKGLSWSTVSSSHLAMRYYEDGFLFESKGSKCHFNDYSIMLYSLGLINSIVTEEMLHFLSPTLDFHEGPLGRVPYIESENNKTTIESLVKENIKLSKSDWDSFETSWDFKRSPLLEPLVEPSYEEQVQMDNDSFSVMGYLGTEKTDEVFYANRPVRKVCPLEFYYEKYRDRANEDFYHLKMNEETLNRIFIDIYGLQDELKPEEEEKMVSIHRIYDSEDEIPLEEEEDENGKKKKVRMPYAMTKKDVIEDFISYAVGCMFGRYSLDVDGLAYAGGEWDSSKYTSFIPDSDNVIPVTSDEWFSDDIAFRFREFVKVAYGEETLDANMRFIEASIGMSIRSYFVKEFYKHHIKMYKKRPIYWLFSSPKGNFNALVYLHRYNENTPSIVLGYLRQLRAKISTEISALEREDSNKNAKAIVNFRKVAEDLDEYERILYPIAMENISLDLDDGVKVNYAKLGNALKKVPGLEKSE